MNKIAIAVFIAYSIAILSLQYFYHGNGRYKSLIRKSVHFATGLILFFLTFHLDKQSLLILISTGTLFSIITYRVKKFNFIHTTAKSSFGTLFYPAGVLISFIILYDMPAYYFRVSLMILTVSDTVANICGMIKKCNFRFIILQEEKSFFGAVGFAVSAFLIQIILYPATEPLPYLYITLSVIAAVNFELISFRGSDNFTIPVGCSLFFLLTGGNPVNLNFLIILVPLFAFGSVILFKKKILTRYGSIAAYLLGIYLAALPGTAWIVPVIAFFISSVVFTKLNGRINIKPDVSNRRNIWQVFANIFFAVLSSAAFMITQNQIFIYFYITLIAAVTADTWASELGPVFNKKCFSLADLSFRESGVSGGISLPGTIAALAGAVLISVLSCYLFFNTINIALISILSAAAFMAVFIDSILSAFLEPLLIGMNYFNNSTGSNSPSPNDIINLASSATSPLFFLLLQFLFF